MKIWPFRKQEEPSKETVSRCEADNTHAVLRLFENMCSAQERAAYMGELYRQGYQGGCVFAGVMYQACLKTAPDKLQQAERIISSSPVPASIQ